MIIVLLPLLFTQMIYAASSVSPEVKEATASIRSLISPLLPGKKKVLPGMMKDFRVDKCQTEKIDWTDVLLMRKPVTLNFKFLEGCDVEGTVMPKVFEAFPAQLKLRNLKLYDRIESSNKVSPTIESKPLMNIELRQGVLYGKSGKVKFEADYNVRINPLDTKKPIEKNLGGEIRISEIYGKKVSIKEKIYVE